MSAVDVFEARRLNLIDHISSQFDGNRAAFCRATGKNPNLINLVLTDNAGYRRNIGEKLARDIEQRAGLQAGWLDLPRGSAPGRSRCIPLVSYSAIPDEPPIKPEHFALMPLDSTYPIVLAGSCQLVFAVVTESSMEPTLVYGDLVYVDLEVKCIESDGLYVLRRGIRTEVRRVQMVNSGLLRLSSDSQQFQALTGTAQQIFEGIQVVGKVVFANRAMRL